MLIYIELRDTVHVSVSHVNQTEPVPTNENTAAPACCVLIGREPAGYHPEDQSQNTTLEVSPSIFTPEH